MRFLALVLLPLPLSAQHLSLSTDPASAFSIDRESVRLANPRIQTSPHNAGGLTTPISLIGARMSPAGQRFDEEQAPSKTRLFVATGVLVVGAITLIAIEYDLWWKNRRDASFRFEDHLDYAHNFDKLGHFFGTYVISLATARTMEWAGLSRNRAALVGAASGVFLQTITEIYDGPQFGFDRYDWAANFLGASWFYAQERVPTLRNFQMRLGYWPEPVMLADGTTYTAPTLLLDDYSNQSYWISVKIYNFLGEKGKRFWPKWLMISAGASLNDWLPDNVQPGYVSYYLSFDIDFSQLISQETIWGRTAADLLNLFHLPAPALRLHPDPRFHLLYYGQN